MNSNKRRLRNDSGFPRPSIRDFFHSTLSAQRRAGNASARPSQKGGSVEIELLFAVAGLVVAVVGYNLWRGRRKFTASMQYLAQISDRQDRRGLV